MALEISRPVTVAVFHRSDAATQWISAKLRCHPGIEVVGSVTTIESSLDLAGRTRYDISIVGSASMDVAARIRSRNADRIPPDDTRFFITREITTALMVRGVQTGFHNYILTADSVETWFDRFTATMRGEMSLREDPALKCINKPRDMTRIDIRPRDEIDRTIINLIAEGLTNEEIAHVVHVSHQSVRNKITRIMDDIGVNNRTQLALAVMRARTQESTESDL